VNAQIVRRTRLSADHNSPGLARVAVRGALQEAGLGAVLDEALLLTTELVTNSVVHAGTEVELEIIASGGSVMVSVLDFKAGPLLGSPAGLDEADLAERGRGLHLVNTLAAAWGTLHFADGKGVWFRLDTAGADGAMPPAAGLRNPLQAPPPEALTALSAYGGLRENAALNEVAEEMLRRLCEVVGAAGVALVVDEGDGPRTIAAVGRVTTTNDSGLRLPLRLTKPWRGELVVTGTAPDAYSKALASLTADRIALLF
jgi:anti-sigma regulatory factor (Ser/Thr protein kinase)